MLPAAWAAWKGAGIAGKILSIGLPIALVVGAFWLGRWQGDARGYDRCQQERAAAALTQASQVIEHTAKQAELPAAVLQEFIKDQEEGQKIRRALELQIRAYEQDRRARSSPPSVTPKETSHEPPTELVPPICEPHDPLDESFVRHWDAIGRMFLEYETPTYRPLRSYEHEPLNSTNTNASETTTTD